MTRASSTSSELFWVYHSTRTLVLHPSTIETIVIRWVLQAIMESLKDYMVALAGTTINHLNQEDLQLSEDMPSKT